MSHEWTKNISKEEAEELYKIIVKVPGFKDYLDNRIESSDLSELAQEYMSVQDNLGHLSIGGRANLNVIINKYCDFTKKSTVEARVPKTESTNYRYSNSILNWKRRPEWAKLMDEKEIEYLDHFLPQVPGLIDFLYRTPSRDNLNDLLDYYENKLNEKHEIEENIRVTSKTLC